MTKDELLKVFEELPKVETNNPTSAMNSINVDDLMNAVDRFNKIPDYNDLLKENQELKKQLEESKDNYNCLLNQKKQFEYIMSKQVDYQGQQKEFMNYLEKKISAYAKAKPFFVEHIHGSYDLIQLELNMLKEILQNYKEIIGDDK